MNIYYIAGISFLFGVLITAICGIVERFRLKRQIKTLIGISKEKDKELNSLRNLPITSDNVGSKNFTQ
jgi:ATP adenylyltransferase